MPEQLLEVAVAVEPPAVWRIDEEALELEPPVYILPLEVGLSVRFVRMARHP
jgi:hypothetical protein